MKIFTAFLCTNFFFYLQACSQSLERNEDVNHGAYVLKDTCQDKTNPSRYTLSIQASSPYEVFFEDILLDYDYDTGSVDYDLDLNQWILSSGTKKIRARVLPKIKNNTQLTVDTAAVSYFTITVLKDDKVYQKFKFDSIEENVPFAEMIWDILVDVPYVIRGWSKAVNLEKIDKEILTADVLKKYNQLRDIINTGNIKGYEDFFKHANDEFYIANYYNEVQKATEKSDISEMIISARNTVKLQSDYKLVFYAGGRIVTLEDKNRKSPIVADLGEELQYFSVFLIREDEGMPLTAVR